MRSPSTTLKRTFVRFRTLWQLREGLLDKAWLLATVAGASLVCLGTVLSQ